jgi:predicted nucleotidyltransferase
MRITLEELAEVVRETQGLGVLLLFGSRARHDAQPLSDWDFAYLATGPLDVAGLVGILATKIGSDRVDLVDLDRASGLLRFRAARDGQVVFEASPGLADRFRLEAAQFWCDASPVLQRGYDQILAELKP